MLHLQKKLISRDSMKHSTKQWFLATRPWSLTASSMPSLVAISYIFYIRADFEGAVNWWLGALALIGAVIFQVGGNLLNDYFDYIYKVDRKDTHSSRILVDNEFEPKEIYRFGLLALLVGSGIGTYLLFYTGIHLLWIGILGIMGSYFYNRMKYIALGDLTIFIIYGLLIGLGIGYVMTGQLLWQLLLVTSPAGFLIVDILHANNTRDIVNDKQANIKTMAMLLGLKTSKAYFSLLMLGSYAAIAVLVLCKIVQPWCFVTFLSLPLALKCIGKMRPAALDNLESIKTLNESVAQLVMVFCLLYTVANFI